MEIVEVKVCANFDRKWFKDYAGVTHTGQTLIILPHAGGSAPFYLPLVQSLAPRVATRVVQYPGRQERRTEPGPVGVREIAAELAELLVAADPGPISLFGHSMGALIAFEIARVLQSDARPVTRLFVSGRGSPLTGPRAEEQAIVDDARILADVRRLDPAGSTILDDPEIRDVALPALRADYAAVRRYRYGSGPKLGCPVHILTGDRDPKVSVSEARAWSDLTVADTTLTTFDGDHFYFVRKFDELARAIENASFG
ncbi:thioesterase II family protein [Nocardia tengchongensis]|uniref:thioesterase II family protein n=1 Tax=Nocardia tengchongensis TaxID=2055889 RepID=UPI0036B12501